MHKKTPYKVMPDPEWTPERRPKNKASFKPLDAHPRERWRAMESHLRSLRYLTEDEQSAAVEVRPEDLPRLRAVYGTAKQAPMPARRFNSQNVQPSNHHD